MNDSVRTAVLRLRDAGIESPRLEARLLGQFTLECPGLDLEELVQRRLRREPIAYITGRKEFWSLQFATGPGALIPRPETEILVEQAVRELSGGQSPRRILDLGTGTACLLISLLKEFSSASGTGIDSSGTALEWARRNVDWHGVEDRCDLIHGGWDTAQGRYDVIVSNPPYIPTGHLADLPPDVRSFEPHAALDGGIDGLNAYRLIAPVLSRHLSPNGVGLLEIGVNQHHVVASILEGQGLRVTRSVRDLAGILRCLVVRKSTEPVEKGVGKSHKTG